MARPKKNIEPVDEPQKDEGRTYVVDVTTKEIVMDDAPVMMVDSVDALTPTVTTDEREGITIEPTISMPAKHVFDLSKELSMVSEELERCYDYIESGMDANGTFKAYLKELRTYRYLLRQYAMNGCKGDVPLKPSPPVDE